MRSLYLLLKTRLLNTYNVKKIFNGSKKKLIVYGLIALYIISILFIASYEMASSLANTLSEYQLISYMPVIFFILSSFMTFMFTIYNAKGSMFNSNDNDILFSMPIKPTIILGSRLIYIYLWNLMTSLFFMVPAFVVYAIKVNVPLTYYFLSIIITVLLPVIPTVLASIIGYIIAYFTSKKGGKNWVELILSFTIVGLIYYVIGKADVIINFITTNSSNIENTLKWFFYPIYLVFQIISSYNLGSFLIFIVINIGIFIAFTYILSINYKKIIIKLQEDKTKSNYIMKNLKSFSISKNLYFKEVKRYFSSPIYVFNTSVGLIMILVASIASIFYDKNQILNMFELSANGEIFNMLVVAIIFVTFLSNTTSSSISIEGRNMWILKTLPIHPRQIFNGKILLNLSLLVPIIYISLLIMHFTLNLTLIEVAVLSFIALLSSCASAQFGLLINLKFPKMDAVNDVVIVKRSASAMISIFLPMAIIMAAVGLYMQISDAIHFNVIVVFVIILLLIINFVEHYLLNDWGIKRFKKIS